MTDAVFEVIGWILCGLGAAGAFGAVVFVCAYLMTDIDKLFP